MEDCSRNKEKQHQLLDLIPKERKLYMKREQETSHVTTSEEKNLELRLGPPNEEIWFKKIVYKNNSKESEDTLYSVNGKDQVVKFSSFLQLQTTSNQSQNLHLMTQESSQICCSKAEKAFSPAVAAADTATAVPNTAQKRTAPAPVVGWPPIRSFRKNFASSSNTKPVSESQNLVLSKAAIVEQNGLFVKINMDGIPIGRKVDLKTYDSYEKLSFAVDELFRGLFTALTDQSADGNQNKEEEEKPITGLLDGSGEYTLVYEDNDGDKMLVGDVPWHMFVSTVKRLRVLKSSNLSTLSRGTKQI
ncbi:auxin-responsive protein IAA26-like [Nicotiana tomentosiformis]|uniref:auxin-responsive protein IAA26-like n=1 Tax=Nicotiana tomentosiformis TaxID=4098 RepID=UPI00051BAED0|nr:auxin-responsive protein IAA26-like isoform X1 [Nicotiana tomentosiformis]